MGDAVKARRGLHLLAALVGVTAACIAVTPLLDGQPPLVRLVVVFLGAATAGAAKVVRDGTRFVRCAWCGQTDEVDEDGHSVRPPPLRAPPIIRPRARHDGSGDK